MDWSDGTLVDGPLPLWAQIADRLRRDIGAARFRPGDRLPGESDLNRRFGVSRTTARAALNALEHEGLIDRRAGRGSVVLPPQVRRPPSVLSSFAEDMRVRGLRASYRTRAVGPVPAPDDVAVALHVAPGSTVTAIDRVLFADGEPMAASVTWLPPATTLRGLPTIADLDHGSLYVWLTDVAGVQLATGREVIGAVPADADTAAMLTLDPGASLLESHRTSFNGAGDPVEHVRLRYRGDRYRLELALVRPGHP